MSDMNGNPHAGKSIEIHNRVATTRGADFHQAMYDMACAQNLATLALAYEQRTANLIALWVVPESFDAQLTKPEWADVKHQIKTRLGLNEGATK